MPYRRLVWVVVAVCMVVGLLWFITVWDGAHLASAATRAEGSVLVLSESTDLTNTVALPVLFNQAAFAPPPSIFGVQMYGRLDGSAAALNLARLGRVHWIRWPVGWAYVEPENVAPEQYSWSGLDSNLQAATASGHEMIVTIGGNPSWAATYPHGPIDKAPLDEFVQFVQALVERYDGDGYMDAPGSPTVNNWEFYNEPDSTNRYAAEQGRGAYWGDYGADYAAMLCAVYPAIKSANRTSRVVLGGLAYDMFEEGAFNRVFLDDVLSSGGGDCFDVMNFHYYPAFESTWNPYGNGLIGKATYLRDKLSDYGIADKPTIVTEAGWPNDDVSVAGSDEIQSRYVVKLFTQAAAAELEALTWWSWKDPGSWWGGFGLLTPDLDQKVSFGVYKHAAEVLGPARFQRIYPTPAGVQGYEFVSERGTLLYVFWAQDGESHAMSLPGSAAILTSMYGDSLGQPTDQSDGSVDNQVWLTVTADPVYVEVIH